VTRFIRRNTDGTVVAPTPLGLGQTMRTNFILFLTPVYGIIIVGTFGVTNQSAAFDPHPDVGVAYIKTKRLQLRETRAIKPPCN
jgi:hypothetical protein